MASVRIETHIAAAAEHAWDALRYWGALHERLAPGFAVETEVDGRDRIVTFASGAVYRERIVAVDEDARRLVWAIVDGPYTHHNGSAQVSRAADGGTRFEWIADLLPDELAEPTRAAMERGLGVIKKTLESAPTRA
jgi:hypothetical protein